jgi:hypothetical protein
MGAPRISDTLQVFYKYKSNLNHKLFPALWIDVAMLEVKEALPTLTMFLTSSTIDNLRPAQSAIYLHQFQRYTASSNLDRKNIFSTIRNF